MCTILRREGGRMNLRVLSILVFTTTGVAVAQDRPAVGSPPPPDAIPRLEFAFEERVTIAPAVVLGETALGYRQYIGITGGTVAGPKFKGRVVPGGFDFQLTYKASN